MPMNLMKYKLTLPQRLEPIRQWLRAHSVRRVLLGHTPRVIYIGNRGHCKACYVLGQACIRKRFQKTAVGKKCFERETMARQMFSQRTWISPIIKKGPHWLAIPEYPMTTRLDQAAKAMTPQTRLRVAVRALSALSDLHSEGYAHQDFHAKNVFWVDDDLVVIDFEEMVPYPEASRPSFSECYDITGQGLESPGGTRNMCYTSDHELSLQNVLGISIGEAMNAFNAQCLVGPHYATTAHDA